MTTSEEIKHELVDFVSTPYSLLGLHRIRSLVYTVLHQQISF